MEKDVFAITTIFLMSCKRLVPKLAVQTQKASLCLQATQRAPYFGSDPLFVFRLRPIASGLDPKRKEGAELSARSAEFYFDSFSLRSRPGHYKHFGSGRALSRGPCGTVAPGTGRGEVCGKLGAAQLWAWWKSSEARARQAAARCHTVRGQRM